MKDDIVSQKVSIGEQSEDIPKPSTKKSSKKKSDCVSVVKEPHLVESDCTIEPGQINGGESMKMIHGNFQTNNLILKRHIGQQCWKMEIDEFGKLFFGNIRG